MVARNCPRHRRGGMEFIIIGLTMMITTAVLDSTKAAPPSMADASGTVPAERALPRYAAQWDNENMYWQEHFKERPYYHAGSAYSDYQPAYRYGWNAYSTYGGRRYEDIDESSLRAGWEQVKGTSQMGWDKAKTAVREAYERIQARANQP